MKLDRLPYSPGILMDFYEEGLAALGAVCERPWHDRLEVLAEGQVAKLWNPDGTLQSAELQFVSPEATGARDAGREVFPGCPLTFGLSEALRPEPLALERVELAGDETRLHPPDPAALERLWRGQFPDTIRWRLDAPLTPDRHFSLVALARCEIQAIDQQWTLRRVAVSLPDGERDEDLARHIGFARAVSRTSGSPDWPAPDPAKWAVMLHRALEQELSGELAVIRQRQAARLGREMERIDDYFERYERELTARAMRSRADSKADDRLAAAKAEHARHRADQVARHEIVVVPHIDALMLVAEPAWRATLQLARAHQQPSGIAAHFVARARRWTPLVPVPGATKAD
jgi:hypothetical protein